MYLYNHEDGVCLAVYQTKRNKKPVMLLSSTYTEKSATTDECKKPLMILDYNQRKGGVDRLDKNLEEFSSRQKTVRWPLLFFCNMVDAAHNNAYMLMKKCGRYFKSKKCILKSLIFQLAKSAVENHLNLPNKSTVLETQLLRLAFPYQPNPTLTLVPLYFAIMQDTEYIRNKPDHDVMIVAEVCVRNTEKLLKHANVNFVSDLGVRPIV